MEEKKLNRATMAFYVEDLIKKYTQLKMDVLHKKEEIIEVNEKMKKIENQIKLKIRNNKELKNEFSRNVELQKQLEENEQFNDLKYQHKNLETQLNTYVVEAEAIKMKIKFYTNWIIDA